MSWPGFMCLSCCFFPTSAVYLFKMHRQRDCQGSPIATISIPAQLSHLETLRCTNGTKTWTRWQASYTMPNSPVGLATANSVHPSGYRISGVGAKQQKRRFNAGFIQKEKRQTHHRGLAFTLYRPGLFLSPKKRDLRRRLRFMADSEKVSSSVFSGEKSLCALRNDHGPERSRA